MMLIYSEVIGIGSHVVIMGGKVEMIPGVHSWSGCTKNTNMKLTIKGSKTMLVKGTQHFLVTAKHMILVQYYPFH